MNTMVKSNVQPKQLSKVKKTIGATVGIPPRHLDFDFSHIDTKTLFANDAFSSSLAMALSAAFPEGESFFVRSVKHYRNRITNTTLSAQISGFIGQEALHSKEHAMLNTLADKQGVNVAQIDREVGRLLHFAERITPHAFHLAVTVALEHFTAVFAEKLLRDENFQAQFSPASRNLWLWHAVEESEHKAVAWDVYENTVNSYILRVATMVPTTAAFLLLVGFFQARLLYNQGELFKLRKHWFAAKYLLSPINGKLGSLWPKYLDFFKPSFHPNQHDTAALLKYWQEKLFAPNGELYSIFKNKLESSLVA